MPLRVLMLGWELPPFNSGGLGEACYGLAKALSKKGIKITFVLPKKVDLNIDFLELVFANIQEDLEKIPCVYATYPWWLAQFKDTHIPFPRDFIAAASKYAERIKDIALKYHPDIIHAHDWMTYPAGIAAKKVLGKPLVVHIHNTVFDRGAGNIDNYEYRIEKEGFEKADKIISVSNLTKSTLINRYGIKEEKIDVVYNGIDVLTKKDLPPVLTALKKLGYKVVLSLGRITVQKGVDYLIRAAKKVLEFNPKVIFVIVGSGDMQGQVMNEAANLGISNKVIFTGFLRGKEVDQIFQTADLFVMPSVSEPFGMVALESVANGTPALISKQSGVSEVLDHVLKVDFWDVDEMANKILATLMYQPLKQDLQKESGKEIKYITWDKAADKCASIYSQLLI